MQCTLKWWRDGEKPIGIEYRWLGSAEAVETALCDVINTMRVRLIEIRSEGGDLLAYYPDPKKYRPHLH